MDSNPARGSESRSCPEGLTKIDARGTEVAPDSDDVQSPETYVGYARAQNFASPGGLNQDDPQLYKTPGGLKLNQWALDGQWKDEDQVATSLAADAGISFRFHARDLHLVLGPSSDGKAVRFRVTIDGHAPGSDHGIDTDAEGYGTVTGDRLYQLIRQRGNIQDRTFSIEFLTPKVRAYSFTFG
jgi:Thioredoxin like C-terminal domain